MATLSHAQAVKSLNKSTGRRRFVFKNFSQRIEEIDINVYRSLDKHKSEPSEGSCFLRDCLLEWRELNTAEDFISIYDEIMPLVQTLPSVLFHKDLILSKLLSILQMKARLSLEPIFRLIASLSRDLLEDFLPFLPKIVDSLVSLLKNGADREPEIIEQIFTSWSYMMMYLRENFKEKLDIINVLNGTIKLRYYPKDYVQEFMAESMSFLLRNSPEKQLKKGIRKVLLEVVKKPLDTRKSGASALLCYVVRRNPTSFHSKAGLVLLLLMDNSIFDIGDQINQGSEVIDVMIAAFQRLCEELEPVALNLLWECMYQKITDCLSSETVDLSNSDLLLLNRLLLLLISSIKINNGRKVSDYQPMLKLVGLLVRSFIMHCDIVKGGDNLSEIVDKILQLILFVLDGLFASNDVSTISSCSLQWASVFELRNSSLLTFIRELLQKDPYTVQVFRLHILRALNDLIETSDEEVMYLLLSLCEKLQVETQSSNFFDGISDGGFSRLCGYLEQTIDTWIGVINNITHRDLSSTQLCEAELAKLYGAIRCYPYMLDGQPDSTSLLNLIDSLDRLLKMESNSIAGISRQAWQSIIAVALNSSLRLRNGGKSGPINTSKLVHLAETYKSSSQVLSAVADCLDIMDRSTLQADTNNKTYDLELKAENAVRALNIFADNLCHSDKKIRISTLRILCHYEPLFCESSIVEPVKKMNSEFSGTRHVDSQGINVLQVLFSIASTQPSISNSRKVELLISRIQTGLSAGRISKMYVLLILNSLVGVFQNRFSGFWGPATECLAVLVSKCVGLVWDKFIWHLEHYQSKVQTSDDLQDKVNAESPKNSNDLVEHFSGFVSTTSDSTPCARVLSLLLETLQKISPVTESRSRQIIPLFLKFLGYNGDYSESVGQFNSHVCKGKEWKGVLKEWLNLLKLVRNPKSFYNSQFLKEVLQNRLLDENDAEIQMTVLDCLLNWKDNHILVYNQQLKSLINSKSLREALTTWSLSKESNLIEEDHRSYLVPLVIRLLMPKVRNLKTLASRKHASVQYRKAVLSFIAQLDINELPLFFSLLLKPLLISGETDGITNWFWTSHNCAADEFPALNFLKYFSMENIDSLTWKKRYGFLHVVEDVLGVFDEMRIRPFLDLLMGCVVRVLGSCTAHIDDAKNNASSVLENPTIVNDSVDEKSSFAASHVPNGTSLKQLKDLRSLCLKIIPLVLNKFEDHDFGTEFWNLFFDSVKPLIDGFKQEGSSSEKPSSLFACFIAMSRSHKLVSLLCREKNLVADIFSMLTVVTASEAIVSCVLKFIENLLTIDSELGDEDSAIRRVLLPNIEALVCSLHGLFQSESTIKRKLVKCPGETEINIFKLLSKYVKDSFMARNFIDILLPFLTKRVQNSDVCFVALQIICDVIPMLGSESSTKILNSVSPLLVSADLNIRICICNLLDALAETDPTVLTVAKLLRNLNTTSAMEIDSLDYDIIINAYANIDENFFNSVREEQALIILSHCVYDMSSDELLLRHSAYRSLLSFVKFSASIVGQEVKNQQETPDTVMTIGDGYWTRSRIHGIINKFLLKHIGGAMTRETSVKKGWIDLLRDMVFKLPELESLGSLKDLRDEDAEVDFFNNVIHLQRHRRARALMRFKNFIQERNIPEGIINKVFVPLFFCMLFDEQDQKSEHVKNACVEALASVSGCVEWKSYYGLLVRCFREMAMKRDKQKVLLRLVCSIFDHFHFSEIGSSQEPRDTSNNVSDAVNSDTTSRRFGSSIMVSEIQTCLQKTILPKIQKLLNADSEKVNVNISLASLKLLKLLPGDIMDSQLPSIVHRISNFLKNRLESIRDEARSALAACLKELGLEYLQFIVKVLRSALKRGYEMHVLGYTVNFLLSKSVSGSISGKLDYCLVDLLSIVENDILGDVAEEKEVDKISSKMKETRKCKSFETLKLIAQNITLKSHASKLLLPVTTHLQKHLTPKVKTKLESMLSHIAAGIESNTSIDQSDLFIFIYGLIEDGINEENGQGENSTAAESNKHYRSDTNRKQITSARVISTAPRSSHLITVFSLGVLHNRIKNMKLDKNYEQLLSMLDPFVILLGKCLGSKYEDILSASLRCLTSLVRLPLPSLEPQSERIKAALLEIAQSTVNTTSALMESCLRLLTVLLRSTKITLSSDQLHLIIQFPLFVDLERNPSFLALSLLKAIVSRKLVVHEIYDVVKKVQELMVKSQVEPIRKRCSQILLQFLLDYHISEKRLQEHLDFLLVNLSYEHSTGKEAVLEMLHAIIVKFPKSVVDEQSKTFFMHLVCCLVNDQDNKVRSMAGAAIKLLIGHISSQYLDSFLEDSLTWYSDGKQQLQSAAAQVLGLLVEVMKKGFQGQINRVLLVLRKILQSAVLVTKRPQDFSDEATVPFWKETYYSLVLFEKILHHFPGLCLDRDLQDIWEAVCELLLHPHVWLRNISSRLLAMYFDNAIESSGGNFEKLDGADLEQLRTFSLIRPSRLFMIAVSLCCQLKTQLGDGDDAVSYLITKNLVFAIYFVHSLMGQMECLDSGKFWATLDQHEQGCFLKSFQLLDSGKGKALFLSVISGGQDCGNQEHQEDLRRMLVSVLLKRIGKIALQTETVQMKIVFNCFQKIATDIREEGDRLHYASLILLPLYKVCEGFAGKVIPDNLKQLGQEVCETIRRSLGIQNFVQIYNQIRKNLKAKRDKRRQEEKLMAVVNPVRNAKRKLRIAAKHRVNKKRKIMTMKMGRWMH